MTKPLLGISLLVVLLFSLSGCALKMAAQWQDAGPDHPTLESEALTQEARLRFEQALDRETLLVSITAGQKVLAENPGDYATLTALSTQHILLGTAYTAERGAKSGHFRQAMRYAESALYTNAAFMQRVAEGTSLWEASAVLDKEQAAAMFFWVTALQYEFKEGMSLPAKIVNVRWMARGLKFLDRIEQVAPEFGGGGVEFAKVICYYVLPKSMGGSKTKGDAYMARAVARSDGWLLPRWARGKYYYLVRGEAEKSRADLQWVANQNLGDFKDPAAWKTHFQQNAKELLN